MTEAQKIELLKYCGFIFTKYCLWQAPESNLSINMPELTTDFLFTHFVPAWNKKNLVAKISMVKFSFAKIANMVICFIDTESPLAFCIGRGEAEAEAMAEACLKLIGG